MDDPALAFVLDEALALLDAGEEPEAIVERFPDFAGTLLPLLRMAHTLRDTADEAIEVPLEALKDIGRMIQEGVPPEAPPGNKEHGTGNMGL